MPALPLLTHRSPNQTVAWHDDKAISVERFLAEVSHLAALLPAGKHILNVCRDRYHFTVGLAAALVSNKVSLLPPAHTPDMVQQLKTFSADVFCLHDNDDCDIALAKLRYPAMPEKSKPVAIPLIDDQQIAAIVFTSGSTGAPVPHVKTWGSLVRNVQAQAVRLGFLPENACTIVGTIPPQHMYGFESTVLLPLQCGNAFCSEQPFYPANIADVLSAIAAPRVLVSTPLHLRLLLEAELELPKLSLILSATAPLSEKLALKAETMLEAPLLEIYGCTETGQIATRRTTQTEAWQLFDGIKLMAGELTDEAQCRVAGGHVETPMPLNDLIKPLSASHFLLQGRKQDIVNIAGKRNSLANLNHHLNSIAGVIDGVFYMPDEVSPDHVTRLMACVVAPDLTAAEIMAKLRICMDAVFLPRPLLLVESLPRNSTGKLPKSALQKLIKEHMRQTLNNVIIASKDL